MPHVIEFNADSESLLRPAMEVIDFEARNTLALERFQPKRSTLHGARFTRDNASASGLSARLTRPNWLSSFTFCERRSQLPDLPGPVLSVEERVVEIVRFQRIRIVHHDSKPRGTCPENCSLQKHRQSPNDMSPTDEARFLALRERRPAWCATAWRQWWPVPSRPAAALSR